MQQFLTILDFYRPFFLWSFLINIGITVIYPFIIPAVITKIFMAVFLWFLVRETSVRRKLQFYRKIGISTPKLFSIIFVLDIGITIAFIQVIKEFI